MLLKKIRSKKKKRRMIKYIALSAIFLIILSASSYLLYNNIKLEKEFMSTEGFISVEVEKVVDLKDFSVVYLKNNCSELSFYVSPEQGSAIKSALENEQSFRPMTHETLVKILEACGIESRMVKITMMSEGAYFGELRLVSSFRFVSLDIRPSDGVVIALRTNTPIYANEILTKKVC